MIFSLCSVTCVLWRFFFGVGLPINEHSWVSGCNQYGPKYPHQTMPILDVRQWILRYRSYILETELDFNMENYTWTEENVWIGKYTAMCKIQIVKARKQTRTRQTQRFNTKQCKRNNYWAYTWSQHQTRRRNKKKTDLVRLWDASWRSVQCFIQKQKKHWYDKTVI